MAALNGIIKNDLHLEKNYCWLGWTESERNAQYLCEQINSSIDCINQSGIGAISSNPRIFHVFKK
jgi:hypothetical protein